MPMYRRKPGRPVEAHQWQPGTRPPGVCPGSDGLHVCTKHHDGPGPAHVHTIHAGHVVYLEPGDWVLPEPDGHGFYPIRAAVFATCYEPVPAAPEGVPC
jgi:hypothetical protein